MSVQERYLEIERIGADSSGVMSRVDVRLSGSAIAVAIELRAIAAEVAAELGPAKDAARSGLLDQQLYHRDGRVVELHLSGTAHRARLGDELKLYATAITQELLAYEARERAALGAEKSQAPADEDDGV
jgi:hypothetical protein